MAPLTNTTTSSNAATNTPITSSPQNSAHPPLILHLNAKQRKKAEAAAHSLRYAQVALACHRQRLNGRAATESSITAPLLKSARAAIKRYRRIAHPGEPARRAFEDAERDFKEITRAMARDLERELRMAEWTFGVAEAVSGEQ